VKSLKLKLYRYTLFAAIFFLWQLVSYAQTVSINEFMASNASTIADEDGDFEDWIEIHNYGEEEINLEGWALSDNFSQSMMWLFPDTVIRPGEFILVWASGKDRKSESLHTNFSIDTQGEELLLVHYTGNWVDIVNPVNLPADISYGRKPDGTGNWYYFTEPTPGESNSSEGFPEFLMSPVFSTAGGFYTEEFELNLWHPDPDVTILFTLDGSEPSPENIGGKTYKYKNSYPQNPGDPVGNFITGSFTTHHYQGSPILITDRSEQPDSLTGISSTWHLTPKYFPGQPVFKGTVVRAAAFKEGALASPIQTHSFFVSHAGDERYSLPVISINLPEDALFDYHKGIYVAGEDFDRWRQQNPAEEVHEGRPANYHRRGIEWEYRANLEFFEMPGASNVINQQIGLRIHGGYGRAYPRKSFRLYARGQYGQSEFHHQVFKDQSYSEYKRLLLRNSGDDGLKTNFRDALIQTLVKDLRFDTQAYRPAIVFVNSEYWGVINLRERYDKHYINRVYGVKEDELDLLTGRHVAQEGDDLHYVQTLNFIEQNGLANDENYAYINTRIDVENFIDYNIANIYVRNVDWPSNNIDFWRKRTSSYEPDAPYGHDGRWRWLLYDTDAGLGGWGNWYAHNMLEFATEEGNEEWPNPDWSTWLLRKMFENESFRIDFINRFADIMNTIFLPWYVESVMKNLKSAIEPEMKEHLERWSEPEDIKTWNENVAIMLDFARKRPPNQRAHIVDFFDLKGTCNVRFDVSHPWHGHIKINTIDITPATAGVSNDPYPWRGIYYREVPITVKAVSAPGYRFSHWEGDFAGTDSIISITPAADINLKAYFINTGVQQLLNFWMFDGKLPNDLPLLKIPAVYNMADEATLSFQSCLPGYPYDPTHELWRMGSLERRNNSTELNYRPEGNDHIPYMDSDMRGIQVRQPLAYDDRESALIFHVPASRVKDLIFSFAAMDEGAADALVIDYSVDGAETWTHQHISNYYLPLTEHYMLYSVDFSHIKDISGNPDFYIRIRFSGTNLHANNGNRVSFNNISLDGVVCMAYRINVLKNGPGNVNPTGKVNMVQCGSQKFEFIPAPNHIIRELTMDGISIMGKVTVFDDHTGEFVLSGPVADHELKVFFELDPLLIHQNEDLIVYPNPFSHFVNIASANEVTLVEIFDLKGARVFSSGFSNKQIELNLSHLQSGLYVMRIAHSNGMDSRKIQILRE
jgi:hypothetical protein